MQQQKMANDSRSESSNSKKKSFKEKESSSPASVSKGTDTTGLRRSARETSSRKPITESPSNMRKSERLEKRVPTTPEVKKKSEKAEIQTTTTPLRRSDRGKKHSSASSSGLKKSGKGSASSDMKGKREKSEINEKSLKQLAVDTSKVIGNETQDRKRKAMDACSDKALFKSKRRKKSEDNYEEVEKPYLLPQNDSSSDGEVDASYSRRKLRFTDGNNVYLDKDSTSGSQNNGSAEGTLDDTADVEFGNSTSAGKSPVGGSPNGGGEDSGSGDRTTSSNRNMYMAKMDTDTCKVTTNKDTQTSRVDAASSPLSKNHVSKEICATSCEKQRFVEYWVPVEISNLQLEQYCATLLSNTMALCSCSKKDPVGALRDVLISSRKCCDHPYIVDPLLQSSVTKDLPPAEYLDIGIKASGKLQLLDTILLELKKRQLRVLILFQPISGIGKVPISIGDILDDFVRQRFGQDSYERVDGIVPTKRRQAALNNFNKDKGRFVFLLERAFLQSIKLSSVDTIIIFDSDWNPMNDLRALQKITIDAQPRQIKIFRLYVCCTVEEGILLKADHDLPLDSKLQNLNRSTSDTLLMWGATYLFSKLDDFHNSSISTISCEQSELNNLVTEILDLLSQNCKSKDTTNSVITRVEQCGGIYSKNLTLLGKLKVQLQEREEPNTFWRKLLDGRNPRWKYLSVSTLRQRKRIHYSEESPKKKDLGNEEVAKKQKKMVVNCTDRSPTNSVVEGTSEVPANFMLQSLPTERPRSTEVQQETTVAEKSLYSLLKRDVSKLCQILKLSEEINAMIGRFLKYIIDNHRVSREPASILQAFLISLCWIGASLLKQKIDKKESLGLAKKHMKFSCTEEEAISVYFKMKRLKEMFLSNTENIVVPDFSNDSQRASNSSAPEPLDLSISNAASLNTQGVKLEIEGPQSQYVGEKLILTKHRPSENCGIAKKDTLESRRQVRKRTENQMLAEKHQKELEELDMKWENKKRALEEDHKADRGVIQALYRNLSVRLSKLKELDNKFTMKIEENKRQRDKHLDDLKARHLAEARQTTSHGLEEAKVSTSEGRAQHEQTLHDSQNRKQVENSDACENGTQSVLGNGHSLSRDLMQRKSLDEVFNNLHLSRVADIPAIPSNGTVGCNIPTDGATTLVIAHSGNDKMETMASEKGSATMIPHPSEVGCSRDRADSSGSTSLHLENQIQLPAECETARNEVLECLNSVERGTPPIESRKEKPGRDSSGQDMPNAGGMQNDAIPSSNSGDSPACDHRLPADLDVQNDCPQPLSCSQMQDEDVQGNRSFSPQVDSCLQPVVSRQCDESTADGQAEEPPESLHSTFPPNAHHSQSQPNFPVASGVVDVPSFSGQIIPNNSRESHQLAEELADGSDNDLLCDEKLEAHPLIDAELPIGGNQPECSGGGPLHQLLGGSQNSSQNAEMLPQAVEANAHHPSLSGLHTGPNLSIGQGSDSHYQLLSRMPSVAVSSADPLQTELERLRKEMDHDAKFHEDMKLKLKSECDKEIAEAIAQINSKYESKRQNAEAEFLLKRKDHDANHNKVLMNKLLADAFRSKCLDLRPSGAMGPQHVVPSSFMHQLHQLSMQTAPRPAPAPVVASSSAGQSSVSQHTSAPPLQFVNNSAALFSGSSTRSPPNINLITPSTGNNLRANSEIRAPAPHIQPFRPSSSQHARVNLPAASPPPLSSSSRPPLPSQPVSLSRNHPSQHTPPVGPTEASSASLSRNHPSQHTPLVGPTEASSLQWSRNHPSQHTAPVGLTEASSQEWSRNHPSQHTSPVGPTDASSVSLSRNHPSQHTPPVGPTEASSHQRSRSSSPSPSPSPSSAPPGTSATLSSLQRSGSLPATSSTNNPNVPFRLPFAAMLPSPVILSGLLSQHNNLNASSMMELLRETINEAGETTQSNSLPHLPDFGPNFESLDLSQFGTTVVNEPVSSAPPSTDVVCLSDDD